MMFVNERRHMIAMIFEYQLDEVHLDSYRHHADRMRQLGAEFDGLLSIQRYVHPDNPTQLLTLAFFSDEEAVRAWRNLSPHREAQVKGRQNIFTSYRLCMADVIRDYGKVNRGDVPEDSQL